MSGRETITSFASAKCDTNQQEKATCIGYSAGRRQRYPEVPRFGSQQRTPPITTSNGIDQRQAVGQIGSIRF